MKKEEKIMKRKEYLKNNRTFICKNCGKEFIVEYDDRNGDFCKRECFWEFTRKNSNNYRTKAFANLSNKCFYCDEKDPQKLVVHHLDGNHYNDDLENLRIVCNKHHSKIHKKDRLEGYENNFNEHLIIRGWRDIIRGLGLSLKDENFKDTPFRILQSYHEIFGGIGCEDKIKSSLLVTFPSAYDGMVVVDNISCFSMCPHHFLPVQYTINFGYIPDGKVLGISKLGRFISILSRQPMLQEQFTHDITRLFNEHVKPKGCMVQVRGKHFCMVMRGAKQESAWTLTSSLTGIFNESSVREEFQLMLGRSYFK